MCPCLISCKWICPNVSRILKKCHFRSVLDSWALFTCYVCISPCKPLLPLIREASRFISVAQELISSSLLFFHLTSSFSFCFFPPTASWCSNLPPPSGFHHPLSPGTVTTASWASLRYLPGVFLRSVWWYMCHNHCTHWLHSCLLCKFTSICSFPIDLVCNVAPQMSWTVH